MKIYIAGKITGIPMYEAGHKFGYASAKLKHEGHDVISPLQLCATLIGQNFDYEDYMRICFSAIDVCEAVYMLPDWKESPGATREHEYAKKLGKEIIYQEGNNEL